MISDIHSLNDITSEINYELRNEVYDQYNYFEKKARFVYSLPYDETPYIILNLASCEYFVSFIMQEETMPATLSKNTTSVENKPI